MIAAYNKSGKVTAIKRRQLCHAPLHKNRVEPFLPQTGSYNNCLEDERDGGACPAQFSGNEINFVAWTRRCFKLNALLHLFMSVSVDGQYLLPLYKYIWHRVKRVFVRSDQ